MESETRIYDRLKALEIKIEKIEKRMDISLMAFTKNVTKLAKNLTKL